MLGNSGLSGYYLGWDAGTTLPLEFTTFANYPHEWRLNNIQRMRLNANPATVTINGYGSVARDGFLLLSGQPDAFTNVNSKAPFTRMHLVDPTGSVNPINYAQQFGFRPWQKNGITFTGETRTGTAIMQAAAVGIRPVSMELGGKNAAVVFADCDFQVAVDTVTRSCFENAGQVCLGTERVYVERPIFDKFVAALKEKAEQMKPGKPFDPDTKIGPLVSKIHQKKVLGMYAKAKEEGANIVFGGGIPDMPDELKDGCWVQPTIWTGLPETAAAVREEIFGPCCHIRPFDDENEVVRLANANDYGLATTIWTTDLARAHRVAARIEVGIAWINSWFLRDLRTAFGGSKQSGIGREGGVHLLEFYTETRNICVKL